MSIISRMLDIRGRGFLGFLAVDPVTLVAGDWWFNTTEGVFRFFDGVNTIDLAGTYTKRISLAADAFGRPNVNPPNVVDQDNLTLYSFTLNTDRLTAKRPPPADYASGPLEFGVVWTNDGGVDDLNTNVRWQMQYQTGSEGDVISGNHANSPKQVDDVYLSNLGWVEHHTDWMEIAAADFVNEECMYLRFMALTPPVPALTCEPHMLGICIRYTALRMPV